MRHLEQPTCLCKCHQHGNTYFAMDCCGFSCQVGSYTKFIDKDGRVDLVAYNDALQVVRECIYNHKPKTPRIDGGEYIVKNKYNYDTSSVKEKRKRLGNEKV